jgi:sigma-B regulation protein RsbU (phosphoserine phosphatase)
VESPFEVNSFLIEVADLVNSTLDLDTVMARIAEVVRRIIEYDIFAILLLNEKTQELRIRFQVGHAPDVADRMRIKLGEGVTGQAAQLREAVLVNDVSREPNYIGANPRVRSELAIPLIIKNRVIGVIDIEADQPNYFNEQHKRLLTVVASRIAIGIENARLYTRVARQARSLSLLADISRELSSILDLDQLLKSVADHIAEIIDYQMFSVLLVDAEGEYLRHRFSVRFHEHIHIKRDIPIGEGLVGYAAKFRTPVLVPDVTKDPRYINANPETRSELCVPLVYKDDVIGVLDLEHTKRGFFTEEHVRTMTTLAAQIAIAIENARLYQRVQREEKRLERDLAMARELQFRLLPPSCPVMTNAELGARFAPARAIGGDLYDFISYSQNRTALAVGDVSGKGAPAAIYAAMVSGFIRSHSAAEYAPAEMLTRINESLSTRPIEAQFVSLIYALWDDFTRTMTLANSGLPRPVFCRDGKVEVIETTGLPLGLFERTEYDALRIEAKAGDLFVFFSDGIIDARNRAGELFGRSGAHEVIANNFGRTADEVVAAVFAAVREHSSGVDPFDDETVVALRVL